MEGDSHRVSAAALRSRGLVKTSGRGPTWKATITQEGSEYLVRVDSSNPPVPRQANVSVTQQLVNDVIGAGGSILVPRKHWHDRGAVDYENRARLAEVYGKVPQGRRLVVTVVSPDEVQIELVEASGPLTGQAELVPIPVPEQIGRYHAAARQFRDRTERHEISRALLPRATRIIHAIAVESERRGWSAQAPPESKNGYGNLDWTGAKDGHLAISANGHHFWLRLQEEGVHTRGMWEGEVLRYRNVSPDWYPGRTLPSGPYDADAASRLKLELNPSLHWMHSGRQSRWADRQSWALEERLPHLFREIEERIALAESREEERRIAAEKAAEAAKREAEERERQWHILMAQAAERLVEDKRGNELRAQAAAWKEAETLGRYCSALEESYGDGRETAEWVRWARVHIDSLDPLRRGAPAMPDLPEATPEALQSYLPDGWSAHGPEHQRPRPIAAHWLTQ